VSGNRSLSNLTVSYVSQTPAVTPAGATAAAPTTDSPLGFLGALLDQILAASTQAATGTTTEAGDGADVPGLLNIALQNKTEIAPQGGGLPSDLLASLVAHLDKAAGHIEAGDVPAPGELPKLADAVDALIAVLDKAVAAPTVATPSVPQEPATDVPVTVTAEVAAPVPSISDEQINQLLTSLGLVDPQTTPKTEPTTVTAKIEPQADIAALRDRLTALAQSVAATAPDLAQKLQTLVAKLEPIAANPELAVQIGLTPPQPDPDALTIAHIIKSLLGHASASTEPKKPTDSASTQPAAAAAVNPAPQVHDDLLQVLATLGLNTQPATTTTPSAGVESASAVQASVAIPQPLLRLSTQLSRVATELTSKVPELAKKLEAVATRLVSTDAAANLLGKITSAAAQPDGTALDKLVHNLIEAKPVTAPASVPAAPQIAAPSAMPLPAPIAPKQSKSAVAEVKAAPPEPTPATADSAPKPAPSVTLAAVAHQPGSDPAPEPKVEAKVAAVVAEAVKADPAAQPAQPQPQQAANAQQARPLPAAYQPVVNPINMGQVAFEMVRQVHQGTSRFTIRLDPPEMGRVDVRMHVDASGAVNARLTVDRAETLDLFQRDRQSLERALTQAGIDASKTNLEFSLRQNNHNPSAGMMGGDQRQQQGGYGAAPRFSLAGTDDAAAMPAVTLYRGTASAGGVNIFA
jgi:flagellar hook-length control protein FliK